MPTGFVVLGAFAASWGLFKDIASFLGRVHDGKSEIPAILLRFENDSCLMAALEAFFTEAKLASLRDGDRDHLLRVFTYLIPKLQEIAVSLRRLDKGTVWNQAAWGVAGKKLQAAEEEIYEWVQRLRYSLMLLPPTTKQELLRSVTDVSAEAADRIRIVRTQSSIEARVAEFRRRTGEMNEVEKDFSQFKLDPKLTPSLAPTRRPQFTTQNGVLQVIEFKIVSSSEAGDAAYLQEVEGEVAKLTSLFSQVIAEQTFILRPTKFFPSESVSTAPFGILYQIPPDHRFPITLSELLSTAKPDGTRILDHSLDQRFDLARQIATAVLFVHSTGWFHKGICAANVILLYDARQQYVNRTTACLGKAFLVGFDFARRDESRSTGDEAVGSGWERQIYQHPARTRVMATSKQKAFSQEDDVYALGTLLVEIGRWKALRSYTNLFKDVTPEKRKQGLEGLARGLSITLGRKYVDTTLRCLRIMDDESAEQASNPPVLDIVHALEELASATR